MQYIDSNKRDWIKPELTRLGKIRDVNGGAPPGGQSSAGKS